MKTTAIVLTLLVAMTGIVAVAPTANAAPPEIGGDNGGCGFFHVHNNDPKRGVPPSLHYHQCY